MKKKIINDLRGSIGKITSIAVLSIILALTVNILAYGICEMLSISAFFYIVIGFSSIIIFALIGYIIFALNIDRTIELKGFFIYNKTNKEITKISNYNISEDMRSYLKAAFSENKALEQSWLNSNISSFKDIFSEDGKTLKAIPSDSVMIIIELIQYCLIEKLSTYVVDYFNKRHLLNKKVYEYTLKDIPEILLSNRFLRLFSEKLENRNAFVVNSAEKNKSEHKGKTIMAYGSNGALFKNFDLNLPNGTKINKIDNNTISIKMSFLALKLKVLYGGFSTYVPISFIENYLGIQDKDCECKEFNVEIGVQFNKLKLLSTKNASFYEWIDGFIEEMEHYISQENFFKAIEWNKFFMQMQCYKNFLKHNAEEK